MKTRFGTGVTPLKPRHWVVGFTLGWDAGLFATVGLLRWILVVGWCDWEHEGFAEYERQACVRTMRRDYWDEGARFKVGTCFTHEPETDQPRHFLLGNMLEEAGIRDGDEYEIMVTATDRRPHGDRRWVRSASGGTFIGRLGNFRAETDNECLRRIERG